MVGGIILRKFDEHIQLINDTLNNSLKQIKSIFQPIRDAYKLRHVQTVQTSHSSGINSICILKDRRLVSAGGGDGLIIVYDHTYQPQIQIKNAHHDWIKNVLIGEYCSIISLCGLRNGELVSSSDVIKIWRIGEKDYELIHTLEGHTGRILKVIELKDGRMCSCSNDTTIRIWDKTYRCVKTLTGHSYSVISIIEMKNFIISASYDNTLRVWNKTTYECTKVIQNVKCYSKNSLLKFYEDTLIVGGENVLYIFDIQTYRLFKFERESLGGVTCLVKLFSGIVLVGNDKGEIVAYASPFNKIISKEIILRKEISCLIKTEYSFFISGSSDKTIQLYNI